MKPLSRLLLTGVLSCAAMPSSLRAAETGAERVRAAVGKSMVLIQQSPLIFFQEGRLRVVPSSIASGNGRRVCPRAGICGG